jgi:hypothetical protein
MRPYACRFVTAAVLGSRLRDDLMLAFVEKFAAESVDSGRREAMTAGGYS